MNATEIHPSAEPVKTASTRFLSVDDERPMQVLASSIIERLGYDPQATSSGEEAIQAVQSAKDEGTPFSVVIMDLALPGGISGLEATITLKQIDPTIKVIVCSGYLEQNARAAALEHGFAGILPKPYTPERLASELRYVVK